MPGLDWGDDSFALRGWKGMDSGRGEDISYKFFLCLVDLMATVSYHLIIGEG